MSPISLTVGGGIRHITATSQFTHGSKEVPARVRNIVLMHYFAGIFRLLAQKNI